MRTDNSSLVFNLVLQSFQSAVLPAPPSNAAGLTWIVRNTGTLDASLVLEEQQIFDEATLRTEPWVKSFGCPEGAATRSQIVHVTVAGWDPISSDMVALVVRESGTTVAVPQDGPGAGDLPGGAVARLHPATPNPFNPVTSLRFDLARPATVAFAVYDVRGRLVRTLLAGDLPAGAHAVDWDGRDDGGRTQAAGVYVVRLDAGREAFTQRLVLLK
jgi:hypothetical protein